MAWRQIRCNRRRFCAATMRPGLPARAAAKSFGGERQRHSAFRTLAGLSADNFWVHRAGILTRYRFGFFGARGLNAPRHIEVEAGGCPDKNHQEQYADEREISFDDVERFVHFGDGVVGSRFVNGESTGAPGGWIPTMSSDSSARASSRRVRASTSAS